MTATSAEARAKSAPRISAETEQRIDAEVARKERELDIKNSVPVASELMFLANATGRTDAAAKAAQIVLTYRYRISSSQLVHAAEQVLAGASSVKSEAASRDFVKHARKLLSVDYRNPVLLIDTARALTELRQKRAALRYVRTAVALAPKSRFVTRAAARYYLHIGEHEIAHDLLRRSPLIGTDPWIQASEIAVATVRGLTSNLARSTIRRLVDAKQVTAELTELASAAGTVELISGSEKRARVLFKHALIHPNDNSLAQAEWAATKLNLVVDDQALQTPMSFEANSHNAYRRLEIDEAIRHAELWSKDEPFASRPINAQSYLLSLQGRYGEALVAAKASHGLDRDELAATLNLLFAQIQAGDLDNAIDDFERIGRHPDIKEHAAHYLANGGALAYALGDFDRGRDLYQRSIRSARARGQSEAEGLARAFFARIAAEVRDPNAAAILQEAVELVPRLPSAGAIYIVQNLATPVQSQELKSTAASRVAKRTWHWDAISNTLRLLDP